MCLLKPKIFLYIVGVGCYQIEPTLWCVLMYFNAAAVLSTYTEVYTRKYASMYSNKVADTRLLAVIILTWPASPDSVRAGKQKDKKIFKGVFIHLKLFLKLKERSQEGITFKLEKNCTR